MTCWIGFDPGLIDALGLAAPELGGCCDPPAPDVGAVAPVVAPLGQNCHSAISPTTTTMTTVARRRAIWLRVGRRRFDRRMIGGPFCTARVYPWASAPKIDNSERSRRASVVALGASTTLCSCHASPAR